MALFYSDKSAKKLSKPTSHLRFSIQDLDYQGLGIAKLEGKTWFVENALPNEIVEANVLEEKRQYGHAQAVKILHPSTERQTPICAMYGRCGGCQMQHIPLNTQRQVKQKTLFHRLQKLQSAPITFQPMIVGEDLAYRRRAKLSIAVQQGGLVVGFRQANSQQIIPISHCDVLEAALDHLLSPLQSLLKQWSQPKKLGHIELVNADNGVAMLLRHIGEINGRDKACLQDFAEQFDLMLFVMCEKEQIEQWYGKPPYYEIAGMKLQFSIRDFIQVNAALNKKMVETAVSWLALSTTDRVLDLFCGMGNFTLPIACYAGSVIGVEGVEPMVEQARLNAQQNSLENVQFYQADLSQPFVEQAWAKVPFNKVLLDPARQGALFVLDHLCQLNPSHIVYVSCNPATLVRDAEKLIAYGYRIQQTAMIDMFPHTGHLESVSLFVKP